MALSCSGLLLGKGFNMSKEDKILVRQIADKLRTLGANELQLLAEEMAIVACPDRFKGRPLVRQGRNTDGQTTKGWPDAYVLTGLVVVNGIEVGVVDGIEATRDGQTWSKHLTEDLGKAVSSKNLNLSGYFFVAGYPDHEPSSSEVEDWTKKFINIGISPEKVQLMIGKHLAMELARSKYAQIRQAILGISSSAVYFERLRESILLRKSNSLVQPAEDEFDNGKVFKPSVANLVIEELQKQGACLVRGHGACGKTTLAYWIGLSDLYHPAPVYYLDLASQPSQASTGSIQIEMVELNGSGGLFIIDNVHINENVAEILMKHWRQFCKASGSHLLVLGRETGMKEGTSLGGLSPVIMHAGKLEFTQLVKIRVAQELDVPDIALEDWAKIFGGSRGLAKGNRMVVVDLIAFSAALERRKLHVKAGNFKLSAADAVEAIREKYLKPISDSRVLDNLLRLAAVAEFELRVPRSALKHPTVAIERACVDTGLVLSHDGRLALVHAALGRLLIEASNFDVQSEREDIAVRFPYLGLGMVRAGIRAEERDAIVALLKDSLPTGDWLKECSSVHDVAVVAISAIRILKISSAVLDAVVINSHHFKRLILKVRSLETLTSVAGSLNNIGMHKSANYVLEPSSSEGWDVLLENLTSARNGVVLGFLKNLSSEKSSETLAKIPISEWAASRSVVPVDYGSITCQLCRYLDSLGRKDIAVYPALEFLKEISKENLFRSDLGDVSNLIRLGSPSPELLQVVFKCLIESGWLKQAYLDTCDGQLCGALMSFANTLPDYLRSDIFLPEATQRLDLEAKITGNLLSLSEDQYRYLYWDRNTKERNLPFDLAKQRRVARFVTMLGASYALWGELLPKVNWLWPQGVSVEDVYSSRSALDSETIYLGMYELQFWLGLKYMNTKSINTGFVIEDGLKANFVRRLEASSPPTENGEKLRCSLLHWVSHLASKAAAVDAAACCPGTP
jgi:hypothetical protein